MRSARRNTRASGWHGSFFAPSSPITNLDAPGCSLGARDRILGIVIAGESDSHAPVRKRVRLGENAEVHRPARGTGGQRFLERLERKIRAFAIAEDDGGSG